MRHITVGVAGHIDHGKTALVRALTGMETDRLPEERERGMSIALGFAHLALPAEVNPASPKSEAFWPSLDKAPPKSSWPAHCGTLEALSSADGQVDLIDVPGHERFVKTMIAGATGVDAILLVIAATERVMPQTVEHLALCGLLGIEKGIVVVTKADLVPGHEREPVERELRAFLAETFLATAPVIFTSAITGEGMDNLRAGLSDLLVQSSFAEEKSGFYLPVDRVFTMAGHGTIVTGTLRRGAICAGDMVEIMPRGGTAIVRGLEVHRESVERIGPGWRAAVNLRGVSKDSLTRGDILATPGLLAPTPLIDAELTLLPPRLRIANIHKPLRHGDTLRIFWATQEASARVHLLDRDELNTGETALVQLRFGSPQAAHAGERFIARTASPAETIGGGRFIDTAPRRHTRHDHAALGRLHTMAHGGAAQKLAAKLDEAGFAGREVGRLLSDLDIDRTEWNNLLPEMPVVLSNHGLLAVHDAHFEQACGIVLDRLRSHHSIHRTERGIARDRLRSLLPKTLTPAAFDCVFTALLDRKCIEVEGHLVREAGFSPEAALTPVEREIAGRIADQFARAGIAPPDPAQVIGQDRRRKALYRFLLDSGTLVSTTDSGSGRVVVFHSGAIEQAARVLSEKLTRGQGYTVSELNSILGTSRKYGVPMLEHLDTQGVTRRVGDLRFVGPACPAPEETHLPPQGHPPYRED